MSTSVRGPAKRAALIEDGLFTTGTAPDPTPGANDLVLTSASEDRVGAATGVAETAFELGNALGIAIGNFANEPNALYVAQNDSLLFADEAITEGLEWTRR